MDQAELIVCVSHDTEALANLCERGVWLDHGRVKADGHIDDVIDAYVLATSGKPRERRAPEREVAEEMQTVA
jgi:ABC-type polysaccharide/polyol phosphate transport system ATPase subunit